MREALAKIFKKWAIALGSEVTMVEVSRDYPITQQLDEFVKTDMVKGLAGGIFKHASFTKTVIEPKNKVVITASVEVLK